MLQRFAFILLFLLIGPLGLSAQSELDFKPLSKAEKSFLDFISKDSNTSFSMNLILEKLRFGVPKKLGNEVCLLKRKKELKIQILGSGRIYNIKKKGESNYELIRMDSTFYLGSNFNSINFYLHDTLFQFGGDGFWTIKDHFTYFSNKTHEWEYLTSDKKVPVYLDKKEIFYYVDQNASKFYLSNSIHQKDFPNKLTKNTSDTCRVFDFKKRKWEVLGKINPDLKEITQENNKFYSVFEPFLLFQSDFEVYWLNFSTNQFGLLNKNKQAEFREKWLKIYKNQPDQRYQFVMGSQYHLIRIDYNGDLTFETIDLNLKDFDDPNSKPIYSKSFITSFLQEIEPGKPILGNVFIILMVLLLYALYNKKIKKNKNPKEVQSFLFENFYSALSLVEKELIQSIYQLQINNEQISIKAINKIIGVQQKDIITQNKSRSDTFLRINQKFKLATRASDTLIVKQREVTDKRVYNYNINTFFIEAIKKLILNNQ